MLSLPTGNNCALSSEKVHDENVDLLNEMDSFEKRMKTHKSETSRGKRCCAAPLAFSVLMLSFGVCLGIVLAIGVSTLGGGVNFFHEQKNEVHVSCSLLNLLYDTDQRIDQYVSQSRSIYKMLTIEKQNIEQVQSLLKMNQSSNRRLTSQVQHENEHDLSTNCSISADGLKQFTKTFTSSLNLLEFNLRAVKDFANAVLDITIDTEQTLLNFWTTKEKTVEIPHMTNQPCMGIHSTYNATWKVVRHKPVLNITGCSVAKMWYDPAVCFFGHPSTTGKFVAQGMKRIVFIGDSLTFRTYIAMKGMMRSILKWNRVKYAERCPGKYYKSDFQATYDGTKHYDAGPVRYGLAHPGCTDCSGCDSKRERGTTKDGNSVDLEYLAVEFSKDYELQTTGFDTTQELVVDYLTRPEDIPVDMVYYSVGTHDLFYVLDDDTEDVKIKADPARIAGFAKNVQWLAKILQDRMPATTLCVVLPPFLARDGVNVDVLNRLHLKVLKNLNITCVVDGMSLSEQIGRDPKSTLAKTIVPDGTHYPVTYYQTVLSQVTEQVCPGWVDSYR